MELVSRRFETGNRGAVRRVRLVAVAVALAGLIVLAGARTAGADSFSWTQILSNQGSDDSIACPTATDCVVGGGDSSAWEIMFNPSSPGAPARHTLPSVNPGLGPLVCPSTTQCTGIVDEDYEDTFDPASPGSPTEVQIDNAPIISSDAWGVQDLSCPSATQCTGVDSQSSEVTFNPQSPPSTQSPQVIDTNTASNSNYEYFVSCPSLNQCTAIDGINTEITFDPGTSPWTSSPHIISTHAFASSFNVGGLSCPSSTQCTDVYTYPGGGTDSYEVTFNPTSPGTATPVALHMYASSGSTLGSLVSCPSVTQCTVSGSDYNANTTVEVTFNPQAPGTPTENVTPGNGGNISCPSVSECVMVDGYGHVVRGVPSSGGGGGGGGGGSLTPSAGQVTVAGKAATAVLTCAGSAAGDCHFTLSLTTKYNHKTVKIGSASASLAGGKSGTSTVHLNRKGKKLLKHHSPLKAKLTISAAGGSATAKVILTKRLRFKR